MDRIDRFRDYLIQEEKSELTVGKYTQDAIQFLVWTEKRALNKTLTLMYKAELISRYAVASVNSKLSSVNCFLKFIDREDCCVKTVKEQRKTFLSEDKELTKDEYARLIEAAKEKPRLCLLMQTICSTGIRVSEHRFIPVEAAKLMFLRVKVSAPFARALPLIVTVPSHL